MSLIQIDAAIPLPGSSDVELCVISCMIQSPAFAVPAAREKLTPEDFCVTANGLLFDVICRQFDASKPVDVISLTHELYDRDLIGKIGGPSVVTDAAVASPNPSYVTHYAGEVLEASKRRQAIKEAVQLAEYLLQPKMEDWLPMASVHLRKLDNILSGSRDIEVRQTKDIALEYMDFYDGHNVCKDPPFTTGLAGLDAVLHGGTRNEYTLIGAKTGHGKTLLAMQMVASRASAGQVGLIAGYEMSALQIFMRDLAREGRIPLAEVMGRSPPSSAFACGTTPTVTRMASWRVYHMNAPHMTLESVCAQARHLARKNDGLGFLVVDYLQLVPVTRHKDQRRDEVLAELSTVLARLQKELGCCLIAPVQLSTDGETRDSKAIPFDAQVVLRIEMDEDTNGETANTGLIRVLKNRFGERGRKVGITSEGHFQRFVDRELEKNQPAKRGWQRSPR